MRPTPEQFVKKRVRLFLALAAKHGRICWYCQEPIQFAKAEIDHIVPRSRGGRNTLSNLALSCKFCNKAKWDSPLEEFIHWLRKHKRPVQPILELARIPEVTRQYYGEDIRKGLRKI